MMIFTSTLFTSFVLNVLAQKYSDFLNRDELQKQRPRSNFYPNSMKQRPRDNYDPNPMNYIGGIYRPGNPSEMIYDYSESTTDNTFDRKALYDEVEELENRIERANKWDEFYEYATQIREAGKNNPNYNWQDDMRKVLAWSRTLDKPKPAMLESYSNYQPRNPSKPSPGLAGYWGEDEIEQANPKQYKLSKPGPNVPRVLSAQQYIKMALRKLENVNKMDTRTYTMDPSEMMRNASRVVPFTSPPSPTTLSPISTTQNIIYNFLPKEDDFGAPIRWVSLNSNDTRDGLAKVTDQKTGKNRQYLINGSVLVPVIDYSLERLGLSTTVAPVLTTDLSVLRTVVDNIDLKNVDETDWLAFETAMGGREHGNECTGDDCQSRCKKLACESVCSGDTCATGCVGSSCNTFCRGPGCLAMCIGSSCTAKCEGLSCESRCRGNGCEATCRTFSCRYVINGKTQFGGGTWADHYPQYDGVNTRYRNY